MESATLVGDDFGTGTTKWLGGVAGSDQRIYAIPFEAARVLQIDPATQTTTLVGNDLGNGGYKWCGGVLGKDGCIYGIPWNAKKVLRINPRTLSGQPTATLIGDDLGEGETKCRGGVLGGDGSIYLIPHNAKQVIRIDPAMQTATPFGDDLGEGGYKWRGGVLGGDGCIYGIPCHSKQVLRIDPATQTVSLIPHNLGEGEFKWRGGKLGRDGCIYGIPHNAKHVLRIDPTKKTANLIGNDLGEIAYKWRGGVVGRDSCIYGIPFNAKKVLRIDPDPAKQTVTLIGDDLGEGGYKWYGGVLGEDSCVYVVPFHANQVLRIDLVTQTTTLIGDDLGGAKYKWEEGVLGRDGCIYGIPAFAEQVLRIDPLCLNIHDRQKKGGVSDSPEEGPDRLGYSVYAEALASAAQWVESPHTSLCVGLYAPWGSGKTKLQKLIKEELCRRLSQERSLKMGNTPDAEANSTSSSMEAFSYICAVIMWIVNAFHCQSNAASSSPKSKQTGKEADMALLAEQAALLTVIFGPVVVFIWIVLFILSFLRNSVCIIGCRRETVTAARDETNEDHTRENTGVNGPEREVTEEVEEARFDIDLAFRGSSHNIQRINDELAPREEDMNDKALRVLKLLRGETPLGEGELDNDNPPLGSTIRFILLSMVQSIVRCFIVIFGTLIVACKEGALSCCCTCNKEGTIPECNITKYLWVDFTAWTYCGSDLLWASLVEKLWAVVEQEFGKEEVRWHRASIELMGKSSSDNKEDIHRDRRRALFTFRQRGRASAVIAIAGVTVAALMLVIPEIQKVLAASLTGLLALVPGGRQVYVFIKTVWPVLQESKGKALLDEAKSFERTNFSDRTGFMGKVSTEVNYLFDFLRTVRYKDHEMGCRRPARLAIFIDDLDRCPKHIIISVLEAMILLLSDAPVTCWVAIDSRIVVTSIEDHFGSVFSNAGVSGHEYLDKIVQLPFCLPIIDDDVKATYIHKLVEVNELEDRRVLNRLYRLNAEGRAIFNTGKRKAVTDEEVFCELVKAAEKMERDRWINGYDLIQKMKNASSPKDVLPHDYESFLFMLSGGIEAIKGGDRPPPRPESCHSSTDENDIFSKSQRSNYASGGTDGSEALPETRASGIFTASGEAERDVNSSALAPANPRPESLEQTYLGLFEPMMNPIEIQCLKTYASCLDGNPRKIKRIINVFNVCMCIAEKLENRVDDKFKKKLLKYVILLEQWPYRMAWLLQVIEDAQQEEAERHVGVKKHRELGEPLHNLIVEMCAQKDDMDHAHNGVANKASAIPASRVYKKIVQSLLHYPADAAQHLGRDSDPQLFQDLLNKEPTIMLGDLRLPVSRHNGNEQLLRRYAFNIQRSTMERVARYFDECVIFRKPIRGKTSSQDDFVTVCKKAVVFQHNETEKSTGWWFS